MKVKDTAIFMGDASRSRQHEAVKQEKSGKGKSIFAGNLKKNPDPIAEKKKQARKQAMKVVGDAWTADRKVDDDLAMRREKIKMYQKDLGAANRELNQIEEDRAALRESYGVDENSQEEKDLQLLVKYEKHRRSPMDVSISDEEQKRLNELKGAPLTEYQQRSLEMFKSGDSYFRDAQTAQAGIKEESAVIASTRQAMLKSQGMLKAQKAADEIMDAARKEMIGMAWDEAKSHVDEELQEKVEAAEEKKEKEEEEKEKLEKQKEKRQKEEEFLEQIQDSAQGILKAEDAMEDVQQEIKKILENQKLLEEDLKGAAVDSLK